MLLMAVAKGILEAISVGIIVNGLRKIDFGRNFRFVRVLEFVLQIQNFRIAVG